jgi:hypothetical protein
MSFRYQSSIHVSVVSCEIYHITSNIRCPRIYDTSSFWMWVLRKNQKGAHSSNLRRASIFQHEKMCKTCVLYLTQYSIMEKYTCELSNKKKINHFSSFPRTFLWIILFILCIARETSRFSTVLHLYYQASFSRLCENCFTYMLLRRLQHHMQ